MRQQFQYGTAVNAFCNGVIASLVTWCGIEMGKATAKAVSKVTSKTSTNSKNNDKNVNIKC